MLRCLHLLQPPDNPNQNHLGISLYDNHHMLRSDVTWKGMMCSDDLYGDSSTEARRKLIGNPYLA